MSTPNPTVVLAILDGLGEREEREDNAVRLAQTPTLDALRAKYPFTTLGASGEDVGLPPGQMGNSEVGHLNFGAGRIAMMELSRIDNAIHERVFAVNPAIRTAILRAKDACSTLHILGLLSDGGVHSSNDHIFALIDAARSEGVPVIVHAFLDGRDVAPGTAPGFVADLERRLDGIGKIGTVSGRFFAMDRDRRWDRVERTYRAIVFGNHPSPKLMGVPEAAPQALLAGSALRGIQRSYDEKKTDEFVEPFAIAEYAGVQSGDVAIFANFRPDRARELTQALTAEAFTEFPRAIALPFAHFVCMASYDASFDLPVAFPRETHKDMLGEVLSKHGLLQFRCAETEKYAHVTYFFNGGSEQAFPGETRKVVPSPKDVATYDRKPEMSVAQVANEVCAAVDSKTYSFVLTNFANPDMVGHTGSLEAAILAIEAVDAALSRVVSAVAKAGATLIVAADHGNAELMKNPETGAPHTSHTINRVPCILCVPDDSPFRRIALRTGGRLADVAPTVLQLLGLPQPDAMKGVSLIPSDASSRHEALPSN
jgi:2,3-bisphosphoglycerate-independent phosphoglycerate mutase